MKKFRNKLSKKEANALWGEFGPYSEVRLTEQTRILDDGISRIFLIAEASINPFTFEWILKNRNKFSDDASLQDLLDHAEYRGPSDGYVVCAGQEEWIDKHSFDLVSAYRKILVEQVLKMHQLVIDAYKLKKTDEQDLLIHDDIHSEKNKYIWSEKEGVVPTEDGIWDGNTKIASPAGTKNGKIRYFIVFVLADRVTMNRKETSIFAEQLKKTATIFHVEVEDMSADRGYMLATVLIGPDTVPLNFIDTSISSINKKHMLLRKEHYITNISRPSFYEIEGFLRSIK